MDDCRKRAVAGACCAASVSLKQLKQQEPQQLLQLNMKYKYKRAAYDLNSAATTYDLAGAASGYGGYCPEGIPVETAIFGLLAAFGVAFGVLYRAVTLKTGGRRKKRDTNELDYKGRLQDFVWMGKKSTVHYFPLCRDMPSKSERIYRIKVKLCSDGPLVNMFTKKVNKIVYLLFTYLLQHYK